MVRDAEQSGQLLIPEQVHHFQYRVHGRPGSNIRDGGAQGLGEGSACELVLMQPSPQGLLPLPQCLQQVLVG